MPTRAPNLRRRSIVGVALAGFVCFTLFGECSAVTLHFLPVGDVDNAIDPRPGAHVGAVPYRYSLDKYDDTNAQYVEWLNAKASAKTTPVVLIFLPFPAQPSGSSMMANLSSCRGCRIRDAAESEATALSELIASSAREHIAPTLSAAGAAHMLALMDEQTIAAFFSSGFRFFAAEIEGVLVGVAAVKPPAHLYYLFVRTEYQNRGIGRLLWSHAREWILREERANAITVNSSLNAVPLYEKFGFKLDGCSAEFNEVRYQPMRWAPSTA